MQDGSFIVFNDTSFTDVSRSDFHLWEVVIWERINWRKMSPPDGTVRPCVACVTSGGRLPDLAGYWHLTRNLLPRLTGVKSPGQP